MTKRKRIKGQWSTIICFISVVSSMYFVGLYDLFLNCQIPRGMIMIDSVSRIAFDFD